MSAEDWTTIRCFSTRRFAVALQWAYATDYDLSWADDAMRADIRAGKYDVYTFRVVVLLDGCEVGADYLGDSMYDDPAAFAREHLGHNHQQGRAYFPDMLREAIRQARKTIAQRPPLRLREVA